MATLLVPEQHATIMAAIGAASSGDVISIAAGTYSGYIYSAVTNLTFTGRTTDPTQVVITNGANPYTLVIGTGSVVSNLTVNYTGGGSGARYAIVGLGFSAVIVVSNVHINTDCSGIGPSGWGSTINRCKIVCTHKATTNQTYGIYQTATGGGTPTSIGATLVVDFNWVGILTAAGTAVNSVFYTSYIKNASLIGLRALNQFNTISVRDGSSGYAGIIVDAGGTSTNCLSYGWATATIGDYSFGAGSTNTNNLDSSDVTSSGKPVFADEANDDFHVDATGIAYHSGSYAFQAAYSAFLDGLDGVAFDNPPSRGAYEYVAPSGGTTTNARCRLGLKLGI